MLEIRQTRRRHRTKAQMSHLQQLPDTLALLESQIDNAIEELGSDLFQNLPRDAETKALIKIKISRAKLYKAKVGVLEMQN
ncbi:hypothetical protein PCASD_14268 [Puccinia coronata f. sp. avenae]|uniref:Uncharacterized protein n=1 Tax=Puccinia coronata f. sp. avenae TaxID=200324 RepID=A0A2N5TF67_9BASI|nr:hypothetical protein PCASD_14268 [Puccinia coronata f. sp. avenae]